MISGGGWESLPFSRIFLDEFSHEVFTFSIVENHYFNTTLFEIFLTSYKSFVFAIVITLAKILMS